MLEYLFNPIWLDVCDGVFIGQKNKDFFFMSAISQAVQDYLKAIYKLQNGRLAVASVNTSMVAEKMGVVAASATNMVKKLAEMKLVKHTPYQGVELTDTGEKVALEVIRHHRLLELYLAEVLGYDLDKVDAEADRLEHVISEEFEDRIDKVLGYPTIDPHGAPIPSKDGEIIFGNYRPLSEVEVGEQVQIKQVSDQSSEMLRYMGSMGLRPNVQVEVKERAPFNGPMQIQVEGEDQYSLGLEVANHIYVSL
ncbi:MAG: DtxR family Mn-dependent transcriptional regulator [Candidatus Latescibacterota bacterium]